MGRPLGPGATVKLAFDDRPGRIYYAKIVEIPQGVGQGQVAVSGMLARSGSVEGVAKPGKRLSSLFSYIREV